LQEVEFKRWLNSGPWSEKSINTRLSLVRRLEIAQAAYGFADVDLDAAYEADGFDALLELLTGLIDDAKSGGEKFRTLLPRTEHPERNLRNFKIFLEQYGAFLEGSESWPTLSKLKNTFLRRCHDFVDFEQEKGIYWETEREYKDQIILAVQNAAASDSSDTAVGETILEILTFGKGIKTDGGLPLGWQSLDKIKKSKPEHRDMFFETIGRLSRTKADRMEAIDIAASKLIELKVDGLSALSKGVVLSTVLCVIACIRPKEACFAKIQIVNKLGAALYDKPLFKGRDFKIAEVEKFLNITERIFVVMEQDWHWKPRDLFDVQSFAWAALDERWQAGKSKNPELTKEAVRKAMAECAEMGEQSFLETYDFGSNMRYRVLDGGRDYPLKAIAIVAYKYTPYGNLKNMTGGVESPSSAGARLKKLKFKIKDLQQEKDDMATKSNHPLNQILYGPPGTGKTYTTAKIAVEICDGDAPKERDALMERYNALVESKRIAFTTFHQSMGYEEFIEGLRPVTDSEEDGESNGAGFRLESKKGIFRDICSRAKAVPVIASTASSAGFSKKIDFFKMSLGRSGTEDYIFDECIEKGFIAIGYGDNLDWSSEKFNQEKSLCEKWNAEIGYPKGLQSFKIFRCRMKPGDIVIISDGNRAFRAIGEIMGDYNFVPDNFDDFPYAHRRKIKWLKVFGDSPPVDTVYNKNFMQKTCYQLNRSFLKTQDLSDLLSQNDHSTTKLEMRNYVLIMDEINRANISKVFGELITLIEPDKRLGSGDNALQVTLPYSNDKFGVPNNLHLIGTMNTADRSIALLDTALRRRFSFQEMMPLYDIDGMARIVDGVHLGNFLSAVNKRVEWLFDRDHQIGHSFLMGVKTRSDLDKAMREKIIPLLVEYFYEDWEKVRAALNDGGKHFIQTETLDAPKLLGDAEEARTRYSINDKPIPLEAYETASEQ